MCGIFAVVGQNVSLSPAQIAEIAALMAHRGPDARGHVRLQSAAAGTIAVLAHERLSIVDVAAGY